MSNTGTSLTVRRGVSYLAIAGVTWGTTGAAVNLVYRSSDLGPVSVSFWRYVSGAILLLTARSLGRRRRTSRSRDHMAGRTVVSGRRLLLRVGSAVGLCVFQTAYFGAVQVTGVAVGTIVALGTGPVITALAARVVLRERLGGGGVLAVAGALGGLCVLVLGGQATTVRPVGVALALLSGAGEAAATLVARRVGSTDGGDDPSTLTAWSFGIGALALLPWAATQGLLPHLARPWLVLALLGYIAVVPTALAYPLYFAGAALVRAATTSVIMLIEPVSATVLAVTVLGERLTVATWGGVTVLLSAVTCLAASETRASEAARPADSG